VASIPCILSRARAGGISSASSDNLAGVGRLKFFFALESDVGERDVSSGAVCSPITELTTRGANAAAFTGGDANDFFTRLFFVCAFINSFSLCAIGLEDNWR
jgi:hypothetical protein